MNTLNPSLGDFNSSNQKPLIEAPSDFEQSSSSHYFWSNLDSIMESGWVKAFPNYQVLGQWALVPSHIDSDLTHSGTFFLSKVLHQNPKDLAKIWLGGILETLKEPGQMVSDWIESVKVVGPGYLNLTLSKKGIESALLSISKGVMTYPSSTPSGSWLVEFVSANPTGPLHIGHARQAVMGDVLCRLLESQGESVIREFYVNDAGGQINHLVNSFMGHYRAKTEGLDLVYEKDLDSTSSKIKLHPNQLLFSANNYHGKYVKELVDDYLVSANHEVLFKDSSANHEGQLKPALKNLKPWLVEKMKAVQMSELFDLGIAPFDAWVSEQAFYDSGAVDEVVEGLKPFAAFNTPNSKGFLPLPDYKPGTWVLKTMNKGDDKNRVMIRPDGTCTYFIPDVAYQLTKWNRGFDQVLNIQGMDHGGSSIRVQAALQYVNPKIPQCWPQVLFHSMVKVMKGGVEVKTSKRAGGYETVSDWVKKVGMNDLRLLLVQATPTSEVVIDADKFKNMQTGGVILSESWSQVITLATTWLAESKITHSSSCLDMAPLSTPQKALLMELVFWPCRLKQAAINKEPHRVVYQMKDLVDGASATLKGNKSPASATMKGNKSPALAPPSESQYTDTQVLLLQGFLHAFNEGVKILGLKDFDLTLTEEPGESRSVCVPAMK